MKLSNEMKRALINARHATAASKAPSDILERKIAGGDCWWLDDATQGTVSALQRRGLVCDQYSSNRHLTALGVEMREQLLNE